MPGTLNIPLTTLQAGTHDFGPAAVNDADTLAILTVDRTVTNGFNSKTSATTCHISIHQSNDNGNTWVELASTDFAGGIASNHAGQINENDVGIHFWPGTGRLTRAEVIIGGSSVAVSGSLVVS
jgi:hypothetical protein